VKIGELAEASSTPIETIRFYEREGLLPAPGRTQGNFRIYEAPHLERLLFIRQCRNLDMSLDEVRVLLQYKDDPLSDCGNVNALLDEHIGHVATRIRELRELEQELRTLRESCVDPTCSDQCGILAGLSHSTAGAVRKRPMPTDDPHRHASGGGDVHRRITARKQTSKV